MAYNKKNFYQKVIKIQELTNEYRKQGLTFTAIFELHVHKQFHISKSTYDNYLGIPAKRELKKLEDIEAEKAKQLKLFGDEE